MYRVQLIPVSQQQNSTIFRPTSTASAISPITGTQTGMYQAQGFIPSFQPVTGYQVPVSRVGSFSQSYQIPTTLLTSVPWVQSFAQSWQGYQPTLYNQAMYPVATSYLQPSAGMVHPGQMMMQTNLVQGITHNIVQPNVDIAETNSEVVLSYDLPLVDQNQLNLSVSHDSVTLQANSGQGIFYRTVSLPTDVFPESAEATLTNEILEIRIPKTSQSRRKVNVNQQDIQQV